MEIASLGDVFSVFQTRGSLRGAVWCVGWGPEMASGAGCLFYLQGLENHVMTSALTTLKTM
jgi:hypothetical protein